MLETNGAAPSALFLAGGGSKLNGLKEKVSEKLNMDEKRVAIAGNNFAKSVYADRIKLDDPEYATPLGIAVSAGLGLLNDSYVVLLNGKPAKLFRSGVLTLRDILLMNGYTWNTSDDPFYVTRMFIPRGQWSIQWNVEKAGTSDPWR